MDVAAVEGLLVAAGVGEVGGVVGGEVVAAGEVFFGAHVYVAVGRGGEHGFEGGGRYENLEPDNDRTDEWALNHGIISAVPVHVNRTSGSKAEIPWLPMAIASYCHCNE